MTVVNSDKLVEDIKGGTMPVRLAALKAVLQLSLDSFSELSEFEELESVVSLLLKDSSGDLLFLSRKALNHISGLMNEGNLVQGVQSSSSSDSGKETATQSNSREFFITILKSSTDSHEIATALSSLLKKGGVEDLALVRGFIENDDSRVRSNSIEFIERYGTDDEIVSSCMKLLSDDSNRVRGTVLSVLGRVKPSVVAPHFKVMLDSEQISVRESAVYALSRIKGEWVVKLLIEALSDPFEDIRARAAEALGRQRDVRALRALTGHLDDLSLKVSEAIQNAIEFLSMEEVQGLRKGELECVGSFQVPEGSDKFEADFAHELAFIRGLDESSLVRLVHVGQKVFERIMETTISCEPLEILFCDIVKLEEFKRQHGATDRDSSDDSFESMKIVLGRRASTKADAARRVEQFLEQRYSVLALVAAKAYKSRQLELSENDDLCDAFVGVDSIQQLS